MYQALYRKWRPLQFADVIGQKHITDTLRAQIVTNRLSHAYLFSGTRGTGKTTCAKILSRAVNCENPKDGDPCGKCPACLGILEGSVLDVVEIDAASNNGVDNIRELRDETRYAPSAVKKRVYIIDEVHMLSIGAFNALLKTLEEPPSHVLFILATTDMHKVPATILSRCQRFDFRRITPDDIASRLLEVAKAENISLTQGGANLIARLADGAMRDALSILDRTAECEVVDEDAVSRCIGILGADDATGLMECILNANLTGAVKQIGNAYDAGRDLSGVFDQLLGLLRDMLLVKTSNDDVSAMISPAYSISKVSELCKRAAASTLIAWSRILQESQARLKYAANRRVEAELTMVRLCKMSVEVYDTLEGRVEALEQKVKNAPAVMVVHKPEDDGKTENTDEKQSKIENEKKIEQQSETQSNGEPWQHWDNLVQSLTGKINRAALSMMRAGYMNAILDGNKLRIYCDDAVSQSLLDAQPTKEIIEQKASEYEGKKLVVRLYGPDKTPQKQMKPANEILQKAQELGIKTTELL